MRGFAEAVLILAAVGLILGLTLAVSGCVPSDAGQCKPHTFQLGC